jgi:imidazolonepropionase-like amidohydrolase
MLVQNLGVLRKHHVPIAIGSDSFRQTALMEALSLSKLQAFDNLTLLKMWCEVAAATIFPKRKIGFLKDGYEALVLSGNPLADFANVRTIELRIKRGEPLQHLMLHHSSHVRRRGLFVCDFYSEHCVAV